jgi:integrase
MALSEDGYRRLHGSRNSKRAPAKRTPLAPDDIKRLLRACVPSVTKNARELKFYLRFLVLTGAREQEALKVGWQDVDFGHQQVTIGGRWRQQELAA